MTEETPGFDQEPDVPAEAGAKDSEEAAQSAGAAGPAEQAGSGDAAAETSQEAREVALQAELDQVRSALQERTQDLQRLQAEFQNYRRRVERDRAAVKEIAVANLLTELLPVLDDIGRARDHGELVGGFKSVAESLETVVAKMGLMQFGKEGEPFDPTIHEALMHEYSPDVTETTCVQILQPGYRIGERTIRPARVGVAEPQPGAQPSSAPSQAEGQAQEQQAPQAQQGEPAADEDSSGPDEG